MADRSGQHLGNYRLVRLLGQGGFAEVYLGEHIYLGTEAAIKVLHTQLAGEDLNAFRTEARTVARLEHPHIVRVLEFGIEGTVPFLVMGYAPNGSLRQRHPRGTPLPLETLLSYVKQVADALQYAHDEKLMHRDIKPENMLLGRRQEVLLSDFGIALVAQSTKMQSVQEVIGTVAYMAPEMLQGKPRLASDQYALGIVVYEWLCGERPFHGGFTELASQHMFVAPPSLREKMPALAPDIEQVVMTALAKDPHQRFSTVQAFATALEQACQAAPSQETVVTLQADQAQVPTERAKQTPSPIPEVTPSHSKPPHPQVATPSHPELPSAQLVTPPHLAILQTQTQLAVPYNTQSQQPEVQTDAREIRTATEFGKPPNMVWQEPPKGPSQQKPQVARQHISRRAVLIGLGGLALVGGGITWFALSQGQKTLYTYKGHSESVNTVAWSPDSKRIASGSDDATVQVWDATDGGHVTTYNGHTSSVTALAWSPDGKRIASAGYDATVQVWDATDGGHVTTYKGHGDRVNAVTWSPDGKRIASGSGDATVQVWDATDGGHVFTYAGHTNVVLSVKWSPDGTRIASGSGDKTVQVWVAE